MSTKESGSSCRGVHHHNRPAMVQQELQENEDDATPTTTTTTAISTISTTAGSKGGWGGMSLCRRPWWQQVSIQHHRPTPATSPRHHRPNPAANSFENKFPSDTPPISDTTSSPCRILKVLRIAKKRLHFEPSRKLYFPYEPGKQSTSAVRIKNISRSAVAFKFQTTAPKSCFMRPPNGVLPPGESLVASVVKFIELPKALEQNSVVPHKRKTHDKFKIVSLKMQEGVDFTPELFEEQKEFVAVEKILQVVLLDPKQPSPQLQKLKGLMAEADAAQEARKKLQEQKPNSISNINDINVLEEWKQRKLARQQAK